MAILSEFEELRRITIMIDDDWIRFDQDDADDDFWNWYEEMSREIDDRWEDLGRAWKEDYDNDR